MHLYFNKEGKLTTVIPHGEIPRQGSYLNLYVLLDEDFFDAKGENCLDWSVNIELIFPNGKLSIPFISDDVPQLVSFEKMSDSEVTFDLEDGKEYLTYVFKFNEEQATNYAGKIEALVSIVKTNGSVLEDLSYFGKADIYIEKTFGYAQKFIDASSEHYKNLINLINNLNVKKLSISQLEEELTKLDFVNKNEVIRLIKKYAGTGSGESGGGNFFVEIGTSDQYDANSDEQVSSVKLVVKLIEEGKKETKKEVVTGIKGSSESSYRKGDVEINKANIGLENVDNTSDLNKPISNATKKALDDVIAIANGKTKTYVLSSATNTTFNSNNDVVTFNWNGSLTTITGNIVNASSLSIGDIVLVTELNIPDRYVASIEGITISFYKMETSKVDLSEYATLEDLSHKIDEQDANDLIQDNLNEKLKDYVGKSDNPVTNVTFDNERNSINVKKLNGDGGEVVNGILTRNNISGAYSVVTVQDGQVTGGGVSFEVGSSEQSTPSNSLVVGGIFFQEI